MNKIRVYEKDDIYGRIIPHKRPRLSHLAYSFDDLIKYVKEELYWMDIEVENVEGFEIFNREEHWIVYIEKGAK